MFGFKRSMVQAVVILTWALEYYTFGNLVLWWALSIVLCVVVALAVTTYDHDYWRLRGVFSPPAWPIVGHILSVVTFKEQGGMCFKKIYDTYKNERFLGTHQFYQRTLVVRDPELIKRVCVVDFQHFVDRGFFFNKDVDPLAGSVLFLRGNEWKKLRAKISPIFSPNKLRGMFPLIDNTAKDFVIRVRDLLTTATVNTNAKNNIKNRKKDKTSNKDVNLADDEVNTDLNRKRIKLQQNDVNGVKENGIHQNGVEENATQQNGVKENGIHQNDVKENGIQQNGVKENGIHQNGVEENGIHQNGFKAYSNTHIKEYTLQSLNNHAENNEIETQEMSAEVDSEKLVGGYTADAIVPCAFGLKSGVMYDDKDPFAVALHAFYEMSVCNIFEKTMRQFWPAFVLFFKMRIIPKKTHDFFYNIVTSVLRARENGEQEKRGDFIDMMMALRSDDSNNNSKTEGDDVEITDMVISANAFIIFLGGFETTSSTLAFLCLELAAHPRVQQEMREEIQRTLARHGGDLSYEVLQELTYMEMVIQETLRLYPPFPSIQRLCTKDYTIPGTGTVIEKGTIVLFPTLAIQRDEQYFEHADRFVPERWSPGRPAPPPGVYMPFGDGPRYCIGKRFAMIQMKCCLVRLLARARLSPAVAAAGEAAGEAAGAAAGAAGAAAAAGSARRGPFPADPRSPLTLHPADSRVTLTLL